MDEDFILHRIKYVFDHAMDYIGNILLMRRMSFLVILCKLLFSLICSGFFFSIVLTPKLRDDANLTNVLFFFFLYSSI